MGFETRITCDLCKRTIRGEGDAEPEDYMTVEVKTELDHNYTEARDERWRGSGVFCQACGLAVKANLEKILKGEPVRLPVSQTDKLKRAAGLLDLVVQRTSDRETSGYADQAESLLDDVVRATSV